MHAPHPAISLAFALLVALSCGKSPDGPRASGPALKIVAGAGLSDTIQATPVQGLVVEVLGEAGRPESGVAVVFEACPSTDYYCSRMLLAPALDGAFAGTTSTATDADGRAVVRLRMGTLAGPVSVKITVPLYGLADSAAFTVLPGAAVAVRAVVRDTTLDVGSTFTASAGLVDRVGNLRSDPVTFEATSPAVQVSGAGSVSAVAVGRAYVRVRAMVGGSTATDSTGVTVVPKARLVVTDYRGALTLESLAGGAARRLVAGPAFAPAWSPTGDRIAYYSTVTGLAITDTLGQATALATPGVTRPAWPEYSRDGLWIYFHGDGGHDTQVFRVHPDGTGLEALQSTATGDNGSYPSPSPDGTRFAYTNYNLLVKTLATGHVDTLFLGTSVSYTRWSPDGNWIAYRDNSTGGIGLVRADGSSRRQIAANVDNGLSWSPDSKWLIAGGGSGHVALVDVAAGSVYPLTTFGYNAAWHP